MLRSHAVLRSSYVNAVQVLVEPELAVVCTVLPIIFEIYLLLNECSHFDRQVQYPTPHFRYKAADYVLQNYFSVSLACSYSRLHHDFRFLDLSMVFDLEVPEKFLPCKHLESYIAGVR